MKDNGGRIEQRALESAQNETTTSDAMLDPKMIEAIQLNTRSVQKILSDAEAPADCSIEALEWLENLLMKVRGQLDDDARAKMIDNVGAFLGECLCKQYQGTWVEVKGNLGVMMDEGALIAFPFLKVAKFVDKGAADSFVSMFRQTPNLIAQGKQNGMAGDEDKNAV